MTVFCLQAASDPGRTLSKDERGKLLNKVAQALGRLETLKDKKKINKEDYQNISQRLQADQQTLDKPEEEISAAQKKAIQKNVDAVSRRYSKLKRIALRVRSAWKGTNNKLGLRKTIPQEAKAAGATVGTASVADVAHHEENSQTQASTADPKLQDASESTKSIDTTDATADQGMMAAFGAYIDSWMPSTPTETPAPKQETTTKPEKKAEDPPQQPPSSTSDKLGTADAPEAQETPKKVSDLDAAVVEEDKESQEEDTPSAKPEENKQQQSWTDWLLGRP